jgi:RNA polymerase sigma-70 factor (ECF subfamily)
LAEALHRFDRRDELDALRLDILSAAQRAYPTIALPADVFTAYLDERIPADVPPSIALRQMHTSDLYLACACARGDLHAMATFDERCVRHLDPVLLKISLGADAIAEIKQEIRSRVLVGHRGRAQIVDYAGRGDLRGWVRVMAIRQGLQRQHRTRREVPLEDDALMQQLIASSNPESEHLKGLYRHEFKRAFEDALHGLPDRERTLLRQHHIDGLTIDELAQLYRVHRSTAARLLSRARSLVLEATRQRMMSQLDVQACDLDSIMRMIRSQVEISLRALLRGRNQ